MRLVVCGEHALGMVNSVKVDDAVQRGTSGARSIPPPAPADPVIRVEAEPAVPHPQSGRVAQTQARPRKEPIASPVRQL